MKKKVFHYNDDYSHLVGWSSDFHISTVKDIKDILLKFKVKLIDKSLSGHCHLTNTCGEDELRVIDRQNGITLSSCPNRLKRQFYEEYRDDEEFLSVDFFLCTHACSMCELFMPFGKPIIVVASTRYEIGRHDKHLWQEWNHNLDLIASKTTRISSENSMNQKQQIKGANIVGANNKYDQEYMKYFTDISNVELIPSLCETFHEDMPNVPVIYQPTRYEILIAPSRDVNRALADELIRLAAGRRSYDPLSLVSKLISGITSNVNLEEKGHDLTKLPTYEIRPIRDVYSHYKYTDLAAHPAVILIPYQVSFMLFFELYS